MNKTKLLIFILALLLLSTTVLAGIINLDSLDQMVWGSPKKVAVARTKISIVHSDKYLIQAMVIIKSYEGFSPRAKLDANGRQYNIGYQERTNNRHARITKQQATVNLMKRIVSIDNYIKTQITVDLSSGKKITLIDLAYNTGVNSSALRSVIKKLNILDINGAGKELLSHHHARIRQKNGTIKKVSLRGLVVRCVMRYKLFAGTHTINEKYMLAEAKINRNKLLIEI